MINKVSPVVWLTGMSGSGKSTLSSGIDAYFSKQGYRVYVLDGDDMREKDEEKLGFGYDDVMTNNLRIANLCIELRPKYDAIIIPVISPYDNIRLKDRRLLEPNFHLIYLRSDIDSLRKRDTKGLYAAADKGVITDLIGYSDTNPYDEPENAEIIIDTGCDSTLEFSMKKLLDYINRQIFIDKYLY